MKKGYLLIFMMLIGVVGCKTSKKATNSESPTPERAFDDIAPQTIEAEISIIEATKTDNGFSTTIRIDNVLRTGSSTPPVSAGNEFPLSISNSMLSQLDKTDLKAGDKFTAMLEFQSPGIGQSTPRVNLVSIKN